MARIKHKRPTISTILYRIECLKKAEQELRAAGMEDLANIQMSIRVELEYLIGERV